MASYLPFEFKNYMPILPRLLVLSACFLRAQCYSENFDAGSSTLVFFFCHLKQKSAELNFLGLKFRVQGNPMGEFWRYSCSIAVDANAKEGDCFCCCCLLRRPRYLLLREEKQHPGALPVIVIVNSKDILLLRRVG